MEILPCLCTVHPLSLPFCCRLGLTRAGEFWRGSSHRQGQHGIGPELWPHPSSSLITVSGQYKALSLSQPDAIRVVWDRGAELAAIRVALPPSLAAHACQTGV